MARDTAPGWAPHELKAIRVKAEDVKDDGTFAGYGSVFNVQDSGYDIVVPGAFTKSLSDHRRKGRMPKLLWQHDPCEPIGCGSTCARTTTASTARASC
jgi:phage head maturation protease